MRKKEYLNTSQRVAVSCTCILLMWMASGCRQGLRMTPSAVSVPEAGCTVVLHPDSTGRPFVDVHINGKGPFRFLLDTGDPVTSISPRLVKSLHLPRSQTRTALQATSEGYKRKGAIELGELRIGDACFQNFDAVELEPGKRYDGIIGLSTLSAIQVRLDFPSNQASFHSQEMPIVSVAHGGFSKDGYRLMTTVDFQPRKKSPLACGQSYPFIIDTGHFASLELPVSLWDEALSVKPKGRRLPLAYRGQGWKSTDKEVFAKRARIGTHPIEPRVILTGRTSPDSNDQKIGLLGMGILKKAVLTFDERSAQLKIEFPE
jgi:predicted aspartyl protease